MGLIRKIQNIWASAGTIESPLPSAAKQILGWVGGERPYMERFNYLFNRAETLLNNVAIEGVNGIYPDATEAEAQLMLTTGLWDEPWGKVDDANNQIDASSTDRVYNDIALCFGDDGEQQILILDEFNTTIELWDARTRTLVDTSPDLSSDIAGGAAYTLQSMVSDGTWVYVTIRDDTASPDEYYIQSWLISDWSVKTGWPATGTKLPGSGNTSEANVIIASATKLAVVNTWITVASSASTCVTILDIDDGTIDASGAGDASATGTPDPTGGLCSDGTYVFFGTYGATAGQVCSAAIADPTTGCGGFNFPKTGALGMVPQHLVSLNAQFVTLWKQTAGTYVGTEPVITTHDAVDGDYDDILIGLNTAATPLIGDDWLWLDVIDACFDGLNLWALTTSQETMRLIKIDVAKLEWHDTTIKRNIQDVCSSFVALPTDNTSTNNPPQQGMVFDGRDLWFVPHSGSGATQSGKVYRLPLALIRH